MQAETDIKILLIDDDHFYRQLITALFTSTPYIFATRSSFFGSAEFTLIPKFDLIILDYHLHPKNGIQLAESVWQFYKKTQIILVTSDGAEKTKDLAMNIQNIRAIVDKKFGPHYLLRVVDEVLKSAKNPPSWQLTGRS